MNKVNKSIGWADYSINPVKGKCPMACSYCYARRMYDRFKWNPEVRLHIEAFEPLLEVKEPSRIFVGSTMELFGDWVKAEWLKAILDNCRFFSKHNFLFLTKCPQNLPRQFPENCWAGVTVTNNQMYREAIYALAHIDAKVKYISFEPLLENVKEHLFRWIDWLIIGQQTPVSRKTEPKIEWVREIIQAADKAGIPVFQKDNLKPLLGDKLRQELPK